MTREAMESMPKAGEVEAIKEAGSLPAAEPIANGAASA